MIGIDTFGLRKKCVQIGYPCRIAVEELRCDGVDLYKMWLYEIFLKKDIAHIGWNGYF